MSQSTKRTLVAILPGMGLLAAIWSALYAVPTQAILATAANTGRTECASPRIVDRSAKIITPGPASDCEAGKPYSSGPPVHLNSLINTPGFEGKPSLSADGLELYFVSDRPGALGGPGDQDIYVTRRNSVNSAWGAPERVPPPISSTFFDITPKISLDGLALFFGSNRPGPFSPPWPDLWVSHRASVNHPWGPAVNLGAGINTLLFEGSIDISPH